ncbi:MAG: SH3 domain protein [Pseudohongiellaceae bacterium]|jgi:SH3 domain protein
MKHKSLQKKLSTCFLPLFSCIAILVASNLATAASLYISDQLYVPVRKGQGNEFTIVHKGLPSGTKITLVERDTDWTKVTTAEGITGWVRNQFLDDNPPAKVLLVAANRKIERISKNLVELNAEKQSLLENYTQTQASLKKVDEQATSSEAELSALKSISASAIESHQRLQSVAQKMQLLQTENDVLKSENDSLRRSESTTFFLYGVFTVLLGMLIAVILPKLRSSKRQNGWIN